MGQAGKKIRVATLENLEFFRVAARRHDLCRSFDPLAGGEFQASTLSRLPEDELLLPLSVLV